MTYFETGALALLMLCALIYGFTGTVPQFGSRAVKGAALVTLGVATVFTKIEFVAAALLVANGTRMAWLEACKQREIGDGHRESAYRSVDPSDSDENGAGIRGDNQRYLDGTREAGSLEAGVSGVPARVGDVHAKAGTRLI